MSQDRTFPTVGQIASYLSVPLHRVEYLIRARGIKPAGWAGNARVFSDEAVRLIAAELRRDSDGLAAGSYSAPGATSGGAPCR